MLSAYCQTSDFSIPQHTLPRHNCSREGGAKLAQASQTLATDFRCPEPFGVFVFFLFLGFESGFVVCFLFLGFESGFVVCGFGWLLSLLRLLSLLGLLEPSLHGRLLPSPSLHGWLLPSPPAFLVSLLPPMQLASLSRDRSHAGL